MVGLFSRLDVIVGRPLQEILAELPLKKEINDAILGQGQLSIALDLIRALEKGEWDDISRLASELKIEETVLQDLYFEAAKWPASLELSVDKQGSKGRR